MEHHFRLKFRPPVLEMDDYQITKKARFEIHARVLSTEQYYLSREADLSPIDLALGWGVMSDQSLLEQIDISQSSRWYRWRYEGSLPVSDQQIISSSGNMHMIPASTSVERSLMKLREGDVVALQGLPGGCRSSIRLEMANIHDPYRYGWRCM